MKEGLLRRRRAALTAALAQAFWLLACGSDPQPTGTCAQLAWPTTGPGDVANHFPAEAGDAWTYVVRGTERGATFPERRIRVAVTGVQTVGEQAAVVFTTTALGGADPDLPTTEIVARDATGVTLLGSDASSDLPAPLYPLHLLAFPLQVGSAFVQADCQNLDLGDDLDGDGRNERLDLHSVVSVAAEEVVPLLFGPVSALRVDTQLTLTLHATGGTTLPAEATESRWYAPGIGLVQATQTTTVAAQQSTETKLLLGYAVDGQAQGLVGFTTIASVDAHAYDTVIPPPPPAVSAGGGGFLVAAALPDGSAPQQTLRAYTVAQDGSVSPPLTLQPWGSGAGAAFDGANHLVAFSGGNSLLAQRVSPAGRAVGETIAGTPMAPDDVLRTPAVAFGGSVYLVVYERVHSSGTEREIRAARIDASGQILGDTLVRSIADSSYERNVAVAFDGANFLVAWMETGPPDYIVAIRAARVTPAGTLLDAIPIDVSTAPSQKLLGGMACGGTQCLVAWSDDRNADVIYSPAPTDIYAARVANDGTLLDGPAASGGVAVNVFAGATKSDPSVTFDGQGFVVLWWLDRRFYFGDARSQAGVYGAWVSDDGNLLGPATDLGVLIQPGQAIAPGIATGADGLSLAAWTNLEYPYPGFRAVQGAFYGW